MFSLLLAAAGASLAAGDVSYADLGYAKPGTGGDACIARFDNGAIEITQAFNESARTISNVAMITGKADRAIPVGTRLWVKSSYGPAWRALVTKSTSQSVTFVAHHRFVGDLFVEDTLTIKLTENPQDTTLRDAVFVRVGTDLSDFRGKLAKAQDCADGLGI